ncbi:hypothetical protein BSL78_21274 [Apostichopus japonicus]|uniref:Fibrinogen C-terminal domain-containing protein n=1 Tax=Stichopus japonicus TaxID=307972 RepID=A0A2G8K1J4_STIJA|nr:hypothetical protein BSL78_21274 [Apostichopus japonicus]
MIKRNFSFLKEDIVVRLYKQLVRPHLEYAVQAWNPYFAKDKEVLEKVQRRATRMISSLKRVPYYRRLQLLNLTTLELGRLRGDLIQGAQGQDVIGSTGGGSLGNSLDDYPRDCKEIVSSCAGPQISGDVFLIKPEGYKEPFEVYCNNEIDGGGWTVIQRRLEGTIDFNRNWQSYKDGFGFLNSEFWIGNEKLAYLTNQDKYELRIDITSSTGTQIYIQYDNFRITEEKGGIQLHEKSQGYEIFHPDQDNDGVGSHCAQAARGGWWFDQCNVDIYLNGIYDQSATTRQEISIRNRKSKRRDGKLRFTEMKIRPAM